MPTPVTPAAMPAVMAIAPLDKEETEQRKILAVPVDRHGSVLATTETAVALVLAAMVPLTLATTSVLAVAVEAATTAVAEVEVTASLRAHLAAVAAVAGQVSRPQDSHASEATFPGRVPSSSRRLAGSVWWSNPRLRNSVKAIPSS